MQGALADAVARGLWAPALLAGGAARGGGATLVVGAARDVDEDAEPRDRGVAALELKLSERSCRGRRPARWRVA